MSTAEDREALASALTEAQLRGQLVWGTHETAAILLPVVDAIARQRAAEELRAFAAHLESYGGPDYTTRALRARAEALDPQ